jgi:hypothetical protein
MSATATFPVPAPSRSRQAPETAKPCWHIRAGHYGNVPLDGLNVMALAAFEGNIWGGETKMTIGLFIDERAEERQREALQMILGGRAGGFPAIFGELTGEMREIEFVPIEFQVAADLACWRAEIPGRVVANAESLTGLTTLPGQRVQTLNPPGSEVGPGAVATWGVATTNHADGFGLSGSGTASPVNTCPSTGVARPQPGECADMRVQGV